MKIGYYPISFHSVTAPNLLSFLISVPPESYRLAGNYRTKRVARHSGGAKEGADGSMLVRAAVRPEKAWAVGEAAESSEVPDPPSSAKPNAVGWCKSPVRRLPKKLYALSMFHYLTPPVQLLMALLLLKSDLARRTCPTAHTTPPGPSLIVRNSMYSLNTGWQRGWCGATLALGQLGEGRQEKARYSGSSWVAGGGWRWPGRVCSYVPFAPAALGFPSGKVKGEDDRRMALPSPRLCSPVVGAVGVPPRQQE